ncbi:MAG TPA: energy-coupling factor ABC transporter permease [Armatimonadota bacterium]
MSHIHLPDGVLPVWLWLAGYAATALLVAVLWWRGQATARPRRFARLGIFAALMVLIMSIEVPPISYHFNLSVVSGILLGPQLSVLAALMVNIILALIGHGGITVIGLNTLVLSTEMIIGYAVFRLLTWLRLPLRPAGFVATLFGLLAGTAGSYGLIALARPYIDRVLQTAELRPGEELGPGIIGTQLDLLRLFILMFGLGAIGWIVEGILSSGILGFLQRTDPALLTERE